MCSSAPDTSGQAAASLASSQVAQEQLDIERSLIPYYQNRQAGLDAQTGMIVAQQLDTQRQSADEAKDLYNYQTTTYRPLEQSMVAKALEDSTPEAYARMAAQAGGRVSQQFTQSMSAADRDARSRGVDPGAGVGASRQAAIAAATSGGAAYNSAYQSAQQTSWAHQMDAAGLGRNLSGAATAAYQASTGAGAAASGAGNDASRTAGSTIGTGVQYGQLSGQGYGNAINANNGIIYAPQGGMDGGWGQIIGAGIGAFSDRNMKEDIAPADGEQALRGIQRTKVSTWRYKPGAVPGDSGDPHLGPMAQDVNANLGEDAAPGGKMLDLNVMTEKNMQAIQFLAAKVAQLDKHLSKLEH